MCELRRLDKSNSWKGATSSQLPPLIAPKQELLIGLVICTHYFIHFHISPSM